jgi:hypothetical protein
VPYQHEWQPTDLHDRHHLLQELERLQVQLGQELAEVEQEQQGEVAEELLPLVVVAEVKRQQVQEEQASMHLVEQEVLPLELVEGERTIELEVGEQMIELGVEVQTIEQVVV